MSVFVVLLTLVLLGGGLLTVFVMAVERDYGGATPPYTLVYVVMGVLGVGGLWTAWRAGSGRWGLRRERRAEAPFSGAGADAEEAAATSGERRGRPWAVLGRFVLTLVVTVVAGGLGVAAACEAESDCAWGQSCSGHDWDWLMVVIPAAVCLVGGLVWAWWAATGRPARRQLPSGSGTWHVSEPGHIWHVSEPGVSLMDSPSGIGVVARLAPGTQVVEVERRGDYIKVTDPDGRTGWVGRRSVF
jgi:hypothetical protein